jgi:hypothetical protein
LCIHFCLLDNNKNISWSFATPPERIYQEFGVTVLWLPQKSSWSLSEIIAISLVIPGNTFVPKQPSLASRLLHKKLCELSEFVAIFGILELV